MAWLDDRIWAHPKHADIGWRGRAVAMYALAYSSGFGLYGNLSPAQQKKVGATASVRKELINAKLWDERKDGWIFIHDWDEHNGERDRKKEEKRAKDRERKRLARAKEAEMSYRTSDGQTSDTTVDTTRTSDRTPPAPARRSRVGARPMTSDRVTEGPSSSTSPTDVEPDDELRLRLDTLDLKGRAATSAAELLTSDPARLEACITAALERGTNATSYLAELVLNGSHPEPPAAPQSTLAPGATGSRSIAGPGASTCPHCGVVIKPPSTLQGHIELQHTDFETAPPPPAAMALAGRRISSEPPPPPPRKKNHA